LSSPSYSFLCLFPQSAIGGARLHGSTSLHMTSRRLQQRISEVGGGGGRNGAKLGERHLTAQMRGKVSRFKVTNA
jgi:hypothetical protein